MKVKEIVKKFRMASNAEVFVKCDICGDVIYMEKAVKTGDLIEITRQQLENIEPQYVMDMRVNSFDIIDNILTIYAE